MKTTTAKILIVDDSVLMIEKIMGLIEGCELPAKTIFACSYDDAIASIDNEKPDIVLLDISLDKKSGIDILKYIRKTNEEIKVIMVTNQITKYYKELCLKLGALYFIDKSKEFETIPSIIASLN